MTNQNDEIISYDFKTIESKWIDKWFSSNVYKVDIDKSKPKYYCLDTWAYPSAEGVHIGYLKSFAGMDIVARYKRMNGFNVLYTTGWDTLGLPAENYAIKVGIHPRKITSESIENFRREFKAFGLSYDWDREVDTADPNYYKWTQWMFLFLYKNGLAYKKRSNVHWCPNDLTVLAKEQIVDGKCERCGADVEQKEMDQWYFKVSSYAERLYKDCEKLDWEEKHLNQHKNWVNPGHLQDWCVSRQRYWGPPIPVIYCDKCGVTPVDEKDLPVILPVDVDFTPTGKSPLAKNDAFVNSVCPTCGGKAQRETDTLDTFVSSAWYEYRFMDPRNDKKFVSKNAIDYWQTVDHYQGTIEHLTAHLVYARFITKALFDKGLVPIDEPFPKYTPVGLLVDKTGTKYSKRLRNAPNTEDLLDKYGGDLLRLSCAFITPFGDVSRWGEQDVNGVKRFRDKVWLIFTTKVDGQSHRNSDETIQNINDLILEITINIEKMKYNVAISRMMVFITHLTKNELMIDIKIWQAFTKLLAPFAPFIAEEMWSKVGDGQSVHFANWPKPL